jgi:hypothetical protein
LRENPPQVLSTTVLVHLDSSTLIRPAPAARNQWSSRDDDRFEDGDDDTTLHEEEVHHWTYGISDDVWHQQLEAASSGSAAGQHRPTRRSIGGRRRALTPDGFHKVPIDAPHPNGGANGGSTTASVGARLEYGADAVNGHVVPASGSVTSRGSQDMLTRRDGQPASTEFTVVTTKRLPETTSR